MKPTMRLHLSLAALLLLVLTPLASAQTKPRSAVATKKAPVRRYYRKPPPVVIPVNYIVRPQLADLPDLVPPLQDLSSRELSDSFAYRRYDGAVHWGIDIFRPVGSPVLAMVDGLVTLAENKLGGLVVYLTDANNEFRFYYAHLDAYPEGLRTGSYVRQGDLIGYVGNSGNARQTKPHLHFEVHLLATWMMDESGRMPMRAGVLNPCPILRELVAQQPLISFE